MDSLIYKGLQDSKCNDTAGRASGNVEAIPERYSIAYFSAPDPATVIEALPCCCGDQVPKRWKPINAGGYLGRKSTAMYA
jgi:isopenicillin N synthase-like dioxygenase